MGMTEVVLGYKRNSTTLQVIHIYQEQKGAQHRSLGHPTCRSPGSAVDTRDCYIHQSPLKERTDPSQQRVPNAKTSELFQQYAVVDNIKGLREVKKDHNNHITLVNLFSNKVVCKQKLIVKRSTPSETKLIIR
ncbi:hypothetical protein Pcinc_017381 [Petrolisthes cinctipes]|uniref:Uncharacterized protein n=1 Tax=Petrolisthes cinctipes TaxID=88211 RepID=A0AAE1FPC1_PETCI|nr:hypothetical protein Pcinc_017381 [Petrolisthes cinctipes]